MRLKHYGPVILGFPVKMRPSTMSVRALLTLLTKPFAELGSWQSLEEVLLVLPLLRDSPQTHQHP